MRTDDRVIRLISQWLGRHLGNAELLRGIEESGSDDLTPGQVSALAELAELLKRAKPGERAELEPVARETLEALALRD
ncbi:MAG: hypothetical protein AABM30_09705 [Actinomycetota bacterium]